MKQVSGGCLHALSELEKKLDEYQVLESGTQSTNNVKGKVRRVWKRIKWDPGEINTYRQLIASNFMAFDILLGRINRLVFSVLFYNSLSRSSNLTLAVKEGVDQINQRQDDHRRQAILDWLAPINFAVQQSEILRRRQDGTGTWFLTNKLFQQWIDNKGQTLFCPGIPGAGKTILTSIAIDHLERHFEGDSTVGIAYLYCTFQQRHEQTLEHLLGSLLKQLVQNQPSVNPDLAGIYDRYKIMDRRPSLDELWQSVYLVTTTFFRVFIAIDALDECPVAAGLLSRIFELRTKHNINFMATSRYIPEIMAEFEGCLSLDIRATHHDVRTYVKGHLTQLPSFVLRNPQIQEEIIQEIMKATDGMFLLAYFHLNSLIGKKSPRAVRSALTQLPFGSDAYDLTYHKVMERIDGQVDDQRTLAKQVLSWITFARWPLTTLELQHALAVELGDSRFDEDNLSALEDIVAVCAGLVTVNNDTVQLVHYTTQQYLEQTWTSWSPNAHRDIGNICVTYLLFDCFEAGFSNSYEQYKARLHQYPLYKYAAHNWGYHSQIQTGEEELILDLLRNKPKTGACTQSLLAGSDFSWNTGNSSRVPIQMTGIHLAAYFGLPTIVKRIYEEDGVCDAPDFFGRTPLTWAAKKGHVCVVDFLLQQEGVNIGFKDKYGQSPLSIAAENGQEAVTRLLLKRGSDIEFKDNHGQTALSRAAENNHDAVVKLLLEHDANIESKDIGGRTPLAWAVVNDRESVVELLLSRGANPNATDKYGVTPLSRLTQVMGRIENKLVKMTMLLLEKSGVNATDKHWQTELTRESEIQHERIIRIVEQLLGKGANVDSRDLRGRTALSDAAEQGNEILVKLLIEKGANTDTKDERGRSPLSLAAVKGYEAVIELLLLEHTTNPNSRDRFGRTPLLGAVAAGHLRVVRRLLGSESIDRSCEDVCGRNALAEARQRGYPEIASLLLDSSDGHDTKAHRNAMTRSRYCCDICDVRIPDANTRYHCGTCDDGNFDICQFCIEAGASCLDVNHKLSKQANW